MNKIYQLFFSIIIILSIFLCAGPVIAEDTIKVLMLEKPNSPLPSKQAETVDKLAGKVFVNGQFHTGSFEIIQDEKGLYFINNLPLENYLKKAVSSEVCSDWGIEEIKAQAVISRTYIRYYKTINADKKIHLSSTILQSRPGEHNIATLIGYALKETKGEILRHDRPPAKALYNTTCKEQASPPELKDENYIKILAYYFPNAEIQNTDNTNLQAVKIVIVY